MVFKMGRDRIGRHIIGRMLDRCEGIDLFSDRKHYNTTRMLSGRPADPDAPLHDTVDLTVSLVNPTFLIIIFNVSERGLVRKCTDRSRTERLTGSENNFGVFMCLTLVIPGKVQIDIRLFVSLKSKECLKRNIKSVLF